MSGRPMPAWKRLPAQADIVAALVGAALPLEFLPIVTGLGMYLSTLQVFEVFAQLGILFVVFGLVLALLTSLFAAVVAFALRRRFVDVAAMSSRFAASMLLALFVVHALKTWLFYTNVLPHGLLQGHALAWGVIALAGGVGWFAHCQRRQRRVIGSLLTITSIGALVLMIFGLAADQFSPLLATRPTGSQQAHAAPDPKRPDVVLVTIDTFAAGHSSLYGYQRDTTPALAALATQATVFDRFYANANFTTSAVASFLLGTRPWTHRVFLAPGSPTPRDASTSLLAQFHQAGYRTLAVATNPWASPPKHLAMPYLDDYVASNSWVSACQWDLRNWLDRIVSPQTAAIVEVWGIWSGPRESLLKFAVSTGRCPPSGEYDPGLAFAQAQSLVEKSPSGQPILLWVHLTPPHDPYAPPAPWVGMFDAGPQARTLLDSTPVYHYLDTATATAQRKALEGRYDEALRYSDDHLGRFLQWLKDRGRFDGSVIAVSADHGENFGHDYGGHGGPELYDEVLHIPLVIKEPGQQVSRHVAMPAEQADLLPTLADLAGIAAPARTDGRSLKAAMRGDAIARPLYSMNFEQQPPRQPLHRGHVAMVDGFWKLHLTIGEPEQAPASEPRARLFDLASDPQELHDLAVQQPSRVQSMTQSILSEIASHKLPPP